MIAEQLIDEVLEGVKPSDALHQLVEAVDRHAVIELDIFIKNDKRLYRQHQGIHKNLATKVARGQYDKGKAAKGMMHVVDNAAQMYSKAYDARSRGGSSFGIFDKPTRMEVAKGLVDDFEDEMRSGTFELDLPRKYQGTLQYPLKKL